MKTNDNTTRRVTRIAVAALLLGSVLSTGGAFAGSLSELPSEQVKFQDLNLDSPAGVAALYSRIRVAAIRVCTAGTRDLSEMRAEKNCIIDTEASAVKQVHSPGLAAYFQEKTGRVVANLASNTP
jgi:UrcA family protein